MNNLTDIALFGVLFVGVAVGWLFGYTRGVINGYNHAQEEGLREYPIVNVHFSETGNEEEYLFSEIISDEVITKGTFADCIAFIQTSTPDKKIIFSKREGETDEQ